MKSTSKASTWLLAALSISALVVGASAQEMTRTSQGVVTPDSPIFAQDPAPAPPAPATPETPASGQPPTTPATQGGRGRGGAQRTYAQLLGDAKTDDGVFKVHRVGDNVYFELPKATLGRDFLWVTQIKRNTLGAGYGGEAVTSKVVRWELTNQRVFLKVIDYDVTADPSKPIAQAVAAANNPSIVRAFPLVVSSPGGNPVIDVTSLLLGDVTEFSPRQNLGARGMDAS